jgi:hypothetical protein
VRAALLASCLSHTSAAVVQHRDRTKENFFHFESSDHLNVERRRRAEPHFGEDLLPITPVEVSVQWHIAGAVGLDLSSTSSSLVHQ